MNNTDGSQRCMLATLPAHARHPFKEPHRTLAGKTAGFFFVFVIVFLGAIPCPAQTQIQEDSSLLPASAEKYYQILQKRPQPGVVFNRFVDAWLSERNLDSLEKFLLAQTEAPDSSSADRLLLGHFLSSRVIFC